jgi:hypothetical protein
MKGAEGGAWHNQPMRHFRSAFPAITTCLLLGLVLCGCEDLNWPFHRPQSSSTSSPGDDSGNGNASECADIRAQIKDNQESRREAPTTSTNQDIVDASEGKADKRIDDLQTRYNALDCPSDESPRSNRLPPLQPAPGAISR